MRTRCFVLRAVLTAVLAATPAAGHAGSPDPGSHPGGSIKFASEIDGGIVLPVRIDGHGPFRFRLDTGASRTVVSDRLAARLRLPASGSTQMVTPTGAAAARLVEVRRVDLGCGWSAAASALALPALSLDSAGGIDGLVGQDVLWASRFAIDYRRRLILCSAALPDRVAGRRLSLAQDGGRLFVILPVEGGNALRLVPDSGADRLVLFAVDPGRLPLVTPLDTVRLQSVAGWRLARRVLVHGLPLGRLAREGLEGLLLDGAPPNEAMGDGLLPLSLFARVTFDGPAGEIVLEDRP